MFILQSNTCDASQNVQLIKLGRITNKQSLLAKLLAREGDELYNSVVTKSNSIYVDKIPTLNHMYWVSYV